MLALLAGAGVALAGGLVWAGVVITTHFDIGILAIGIGAATGLTVKRVLGEGVATGDRIAAGVFAAAGIAVGKYVIFVHAVRTALGSLLAAQGLSVGYLDSRQMSIFVHNIGSIVRPILCVVDRARVRRSTPHDTRRRLARTSTGSTARERRAGRCRRPELVPPVTHWKRARRGRTARGRCRRTCARP